MTPTPTESAMKMAADFAEHWLCNNLTRTDRKTGETEDFISSLMALINRAQDAEREACAVLARNFPASIHGGLAVNPRQCAEQVSYEISTAIRSLGNAP